VKRIKIKCDGREPDGSRCGNSVEVPAEEERCLEKPGWLFRKAIDCMRTLDGATLLGERTFHYCPSCLPRVEPPPHPKLTEKRTEVSKSPSS